MLRSNLVFSSAVLALALVACDNGVTVTDDAGVATDADTTTDAGLRADSGPRDSGPGDECAAAQAQALSTLGCNGGFATGDGTPNEDLGACTPGDEANPAGSCTNLEAVCSAAEGATSGTCLPFCDEAATYISTGDCPTGARCFTLEGYALCFRDCDATHPCPTGEECDGEGSCVPADVIPTDGGVPDTDGGVTDTDGGVIGTDAGVPDTDAGVPDTDAGVPDTDAGIALPDAGIALPDASLPG